MCDSSDDDSDIETLFARAESKTNNVTTTAATIDLAGDDDSDDSDEDSDVCMPLPTRRSKRGRITVDERLAQFSRDRNIQKRNRSQSLRNRGGGDDSDSDDDDGYEETRCHGSSRKGSIDKDAIEVEIIDVTVGEENSEPKANLNNSVANSAQKSLFKDLTVDNDEDVTCSSRKSIAQLKRQGVSKSQLDQLRHTENLINNLKESEAESERAQDLAMQQDAIQTQQHLLAASRQRSSPIPLTIRAKFQRDDVCEKTENTTLTVLPSVTFSQIQDLFLQEHKLPSASATLFFRFKDSPVSMVRTPNDYQMEAGSVVEASVLLSGFVPGKTKPSKAKTGPMLSIVLRRALDSKKKSEEDVVQLGTKETFDVLRTKYRKLKGLAKSKKISFQFDGETLRDQQTPAALDMESEDLIDVVVK